MKNKTNFLRSLLLFMVVFLVFAISCNKDDDNDNDDIIECVIGEECIDIDNNVYSTVVIGNRVWFAENLRTTKYNNGTPIATGHDKNQWAALTSGAYAVFPHSDIDGLNSDAEVLEAYGAIYNWFAVEKHNLCPLGWRVPTIEDWDLLILNTGGEIYAGCNLKSTRTSPDAHPRWDSPNLYATDEYCFSALPGGFRDSYGYFSYIGYCGYWWSSTEFSSSDAWHIFMHYDDCGAPKYNTNKKFGSSVRCVKTLAN